MNHRTAVRHLWWKELRQLVPLYLMLGGIALFLFVLFSLNRTGQSVGPLSVLVGLPGFFAVGAGALLVGQEKESRTLIWLASLPTFAKDIILTKLWVSLLGLVSMWLLSIGLAMIFAHDALSALGMPAGFAPSVTFSNSFNDGAGNVFTWVLHSVFLLLAGTALAWRIPSSLGSLIALVPLSVVPGVVAYLISVIAIDGFQPSFHSPPVLLMLACQLVAIAIVSWWGWNCAIGAMTAARPASLKLASQRGGAARADLLKSSPGPQFSTLLWQFARQNFVILLGCFSILLVSCAVIPMTNQDSVWQVIATLVFGIAISWLGIVTFQGDRLHNRIRFLADRGVSPSKVWLSRQILPGVIVVATAGLAIAWWITLNGAEAQQSWKIAVIFGGVFILYSVSQWAAQVISSPIVSAIVGPAAGGAASVYLTTVYIQFGAPIWLLGICTLLFMLATYWLMPRWMDYRRDKWFWLGHLLAATGFLALPITPFGIAAFTTPGMSPSVRKEILGEATFRTNEAYMVPPQQVVLKTEFPHGDSSVLKIFRASRNEDDSLPSQKAALAEQSLRDQVQRWQGLSIQLGRGVADFLHKELTLIRLASANPESGLEPRNDATRYRSLMDLSVELVEELRRSHRIVDQDSADQIEIGLVRELLQPEAETLLNNKTRTRVVNVLADRQGRRAARRRAIALSFRMTVYEPSEFGGYALGDFYSSNAISRLKHAKRIELIAELLWEYVNSTGDTTSLRREIADLWDSPELFYGLGLAGKFCRADDVNEYAFQGGDSMRYAPATQWNAGWETQAEELGR